MPRHIKILGRGTAIHTPNFRTKREGRSTVMLTKYCPDKGHQATGQPQIEEWTQLCLLTARRCLLRQWISPQPSQLHNVQTDLHKLFKLERFNLKTKSNNKKTPDFFQEMEQVPNSTSHRRRNRGATNHFQIHPMRERTKSEQTANTRRTL